MADTLQIVRWALERSCPMRQGKNWADPENTFMQLQDIWRYDWALARGTILNGICVFHEFAGRKHSPPEWFGFKQDETMVKFGGLEVINQNCHTCEANILLMENLQRKLAGCHGRFYIPPANEQIQEVVKAAGLESQLQNLFLPTNPIWFGLWASSPLTVDQCKVLSMLLPQIAMDEREY